MDGLTPVAFFIFNRPDTTARVFEAIRQARPPRLLVVADGPRPDRPGEAELCAAARAVVERIDWPCTVLKNYSPTNLGCRERVASGLDWVFREVAEAIILEDDCLPDASFFPFCELMLERYRHDERVMMIGGTNYLLDRLQISESYCFSRYFAIWGWASWRRAWNCYDIRMSDWPKQRKERQLEAFYSQPFMRRHIRSAFDAAFDKSINTWDGQWFYSCLFNNGLSIVPRVNLISNIGTHGAHSSGGSPNNFFKLFSLDTNNLLHPRQVYPNSHYDVPFFRQQFKWSFAGFTRSLGACIKKRIRGWRGFNLAKGSVKPDV